MDARTRLSFAMSSSPSAQLNAPAASGGWQALLGWRRVRTVAIVCALFVLLFSFGWNSALWHLVARVYGVGFTLLLVFGLFEQWPRRLPHWMARWALQVVAVGVAVPLAFFVAFLVSTSAGAPPFWKTSRLEGFMTFTFLGMLVAPWTALAALLRHREAKVEKQAIDFELERSEMARQALDARMRLLTAQAQPHFLFNTLANVRALVGSGSPKAVPVLDSLIAYLRAAVPRLHDSATTLGQELDLVRAYLDLMQLRMPDRLQSAIHAEPALLGQRCPPTTVLTLVENAVRHGIDPSEEGGRIDVLVQRLGDRCLLRVTDTGVGLGETGGSLGTGLANLRERLQLAFAGRAQLRLTSHAPQGVCAEVDLPLELPP